MSTPTDEQRDHPTQPQRQMMNTALMMVQLNSEMATMAALVVQLNLLNLGSSTNDGETNLAEDTTTVEDIHSTVGTLMCTWGTLTRPQRDALNRQRYGKRTSNKKVKQLATKRKIANAAHMGSTRTAASVSQKQAAKDADAGRKVVKRAARTEDQKQAAKDADAGRKVVKRAARTEDEIQADQDSDAARKRATSASKAAQRKKLTADFSTTKLTADTNFDGYETNPETAVMLLYANSGYGRFSGLETIHRHDDMKKEFKEVFKTFPEGMRAHWEQQARELSEDELKDLRETYDQLLYDLAALPRGLSDRYRDAVASGSIETMQKVSREICGVLAEQSSDEKVRAHWEEQRDKE